MPTVRVTCLLCEHPVEVVAAEVVLHLESVAPEAGNRYGFTCPVCAVYVVRRASEAVVAALLASGVQVSVDELPPWERGAHPGIVLVDAGPHQHDATPRRPEHVPPTSAPPITEADVLLFRKALDDDAILAAWLQA